MPLEPLITRVLAVFSKLPFLKKTKPEPTQEEIEEQAREDEFRDATMFKLAQDPLVLHELGEKGFSSGYITKPDGTKSKYFICGNSMGGIVEDEGNKS